MMNGVGHLRSGGYRADMSAPVTSGHGDSPSATQNFEGVVQPPMCVKCEVRPAKPCKASSTGFQLDCGECGMTFKEKISYRRRRNNKRKEAIRKENGLCVDCGKKAREGKTYCYNCLYKRNERHNETKKKRFDGYKVYKAVCECGEILYVGASSDLGIRKRTHELVGQRFWNRQNQSKNKSLFSCILKAPGSKVEFEVISVHNDKMSASIQEKINIERLKPICNKGNSMTSFIGKRGKK